jgi:hypothetical protein
MTPPSLPVFAPLTGLVEQLVAASRVGLSAAEQLEVDRILLALTADTARIVAARDHDDFCDALRRWGIDLVELAAVLFAPLAALGVAGADLAMPLAIKLLRSRYPRLSAVLTVAGVIVDHPTKGASFDWVALRDLVADPPALVDEVFWDELFAGQDIEGTGRAPAVLLALLLLAPDTVNALRRGELRIAALDPPPVQPTAAQPWRDLRARSAGWVPITFPLRPGQDLRLVLTEFTDLRGDVVPELAMSLLIRSRRRSVNGRQVTDFEMWLHPAADAPRHELRADSGFLVRLEPGVRAGLGHDGDTGTWNAAVRPRSGEAANEASLLLRRDTPGELPDILLGPPYDTRLVVQDLSAEVRLRESGEPNVEVAGTIDGFGIVVTNRWLRSLGEANTSLREGLRFDLDLVARIVDGSGFSLRADGELATRWHIDKKLDLKVLNVRVHSITLAVPIRATEEHLDIRAEARLHLSATVGPVTLVLDGAGGWVGWWAEEPGGDKHCIGLLPPTGAGLQLDLPGVTAGGFLDFTGGPSDRYGGVVTAAIGAPKGTSGFSITGFGIHELTGSPGDTDRRTSVVVVLGTTFLPGIPVGWGFNLTGLGGILGINRRADTDALRERLTSGAVGNVLFADDPVRNAPVLLGDLDAIFPARAGVYVVGLTCQLGWISVLDDSFVKLAVGVIVELPGPTKIVVLGSARLQVPRFESVLSLQIDVVGVVDLVRETFEVDATILRGKLLNLFVITGDAALRASWGDRPYLMASLGGFHPNFHPEPAVFPKLTRFRLAIDKKRLPKALSLAGEGYVAVTTNTIQLGVDFIAVISSGNWNIEGRIGGDALVRLPFFFDVSIHGSVRIRWKSHTLAGVRLEGGLTGPRPLTLRGELCIELLFFDVCYSDSWELTSSDVPVGALVQSLVPVLAAELDSPVNLTMTGGADPHVLVEVRDVGDRPVFDPRGPLTWEQHRVPLGFTVTTFEGDRLASPQRVTVTAAAADPLKDWFSPGQFLALSEAETLALPSFERHQSGLVVGLEETRSAPTTATVEVEEIRLPAPPHVGGSMTVPDGVLDRMLGRDAPVTIPPRPPRFAVTDELFRVDAVAPGELLSAVEAHTRTRMAADPADGSPPVQHRADRLVDLVVG